MEVAAFVTELLRALTEAERFDRFELGTEGPVAKGYAYIQGEGEYALRFYFNQRTQTLAFALIYSGRRIWGIDRDNLRGWHLHPVDNPSHHVQIEPSSVSEIIARICEILVSQLD
jgi:hypothetical protein